MLTFLINITKKSKAPSSYLMVCGIIVWSADFCVLRNWVQFGKYVYLMPASEDFTFLLRNT